MFKYGMKLRPAGPGCQPAGFIKFDESDSRYHNVLYYDHELSKEEIINFSLDDLNPHAAPAYTEEEIVAKFEAGEISYEEAVALYEAL